MSGEVIAIDGPAASGKSTAARNVARLLGFRHLNSGLLYRAVTWAAVRRGWVDAGPEAFGRRLEGLDLRLVPREDDYGVRVDGEDPGAGLTAEDVVDRVSEVAARGPVRERVNRLVRAEGRRADLVVDGRDIGTAVFPDAALKIYLVASPRERARRRLEERGEAVSEPMLRREAGRIRARDDRDSSRELAPLRRAEDAVVLDTTDLGPEEVARRIADEAERRGVGAGG